MFVVDVTASPSTSSQVLARVGRSLLPPPEPVPGRKRREYPRSDHDTPNKPYLVPTIYFSACSLVFVWVGECYACRVCSRVEGWQGTDDEKESEDDEEPETITREGSRHEPLPYRTYRHAYDRLCCSNQIHYEMRYNIYQMVHYKNMCDVLLACRQSEEWRSFRSVQ